MRRRRRRPRALRPRTRQRLGLVDPSLRAHGLGEQPGNRREQVTLADLREIVVAAPKLALGDHGVARQQLDAARMEGDRRGIDEQVELLERREAVR